MCIPNAYSGESMHDLRSSILSGPAERPATPVAAKKQKPAGLGGLTAIAVKREETRITNQRCEDRLRDIVEETVMVFRRKKVGVKVVNVSSRGAMLASDAEARIGEKLDLIFTDKAKTKCVVRWVREGRIGVEFINETIFWDSAAQASGPVLRFDGADVPAPREVVEREVRQTLLRNGTLYWSGISVPVRMRNISSGGAKLEAPKEFKPGVEVELDLGEAGFQYAEVRWAKDGQIGLRFAAEFDLDTLAPAPPPSSQAPVPLLKPAYLETETQADSPWAARFERLKLTDLQPPRED